jgi:uncharacterized membrane protein YfcA
MPGHELLFVLLALCAELLGTLAGFGSSSFFVPVALYLEDFRTVLALTAILHVFSNGIKLVLFRRAANWPLALAFILPGVPMVALGAWLSQYLQSSLFSLVLGAFLVCYAALFIWKPNLQLTASRLNSVLAGALAGLVTGLLGTGGSIRAAGLTAFGLGKEGFIATNALVDLFTDSTRAVMYLWQGYLPKDHLFYIPLLVVAAFVGSWLGKQVVQRISEVRYRLWVRSLILCLGAWMVLEGVWGL